MNNPIDAYSQPDPKSRESIDAHFKKKKMWRNLFWVNLALSLFLVAMFWLPLKVSKIDEFLSSSSVNMPQKGTFDEALSLDPEPLVSIKNMMPARYVLINASSEKDWSYFDFSRGKQVKVSDVHSLDWDLAFRRGKVISNGGATNRFGHSGLIDLGEKDFDRITTVPEKNYTADNSTRTETENKVVLKWYQYNYLSHKLTAKINSYAVKTADNKFAKIQFMNFYCSNKEPGCIKIRYVYQDNGSQSFLINEENISSPASQEIQEEKAL